MASKKEGGKNRKIGRHARNPSSANQAKRSERNKARNIKRALAQTEKAHIKAERRARRKGLPIPKFAPATHLMPEPMPYNAHATTGRSITGKTLWETVTFRGRRERVYCN